MRSRSAVLFALPALLIATGWLRLEDEPRSSGKVLALVLLAFAPALVGPWWGRMLAAAGTTLAAAWIALGVSPLRAVPFDDERDFFGPALDRFRDGFLEYYDVPQPFDTVEYPLMHGVVLVAIFGFGLAVALAIAARRPLAASAALFVGAAWPTTLVASGSDFARGALTLVAVLALLAAGGQRAPRAYRPAVLAAAALVAVSLAAVASSAVAKDEFLSWRDWDFYDLPDDPVGVQYVWDANYGGIDFPEEPTKVLTVTGPRRALYWRSTTLDLFDGDRWLEHLAPVAVARGEVEIQDALLPRRARDRSAWIRAEVEIEALRDDHLPAASMPVAYDADGLGPVQYRSGGVAELPSGLERDQRYSVWSYAPRPSPVQLARSGLDDRAPEAQLSRYLELTPGVSARLFGRAGRDEHLERLFAEPDVAPFIVRYRPLYEQAREVVGRPQTPYAAVVALEAWLRSKGGFVYDERPRVAFSVPPLVDFVTRGKRGYCQHYAGAMALMLRYLGIPARVAVGFTSGSYDADRHRWTVTDHNAHAWVEVWFQYWGWLPFDPTPARGQLSGTYTAASQNFNSRDASRLVELAGGALSNVNLGASRGEFAETRLAPTNPFQRAGRSAVSAAAAHGGSLLRLLVLLLTALAGTIVAVKLVLRRVRYLTRDPRRVAAACRRELVDFLVDQRLPVARSATLEELGAILRDEYALDARPFVGTVGRARYGPPRDAGEELPRARRRMRELRRGLRRRLGLVARFRGALSLRSLAA